MLNQDLEEIEQAFTQYKKDPNFTSKQNLRMKSYNDLFIIEQNPEKESPYARLKNAGLPIAHIIDDENEIFVAFTIKSNIYIKPALLNQYIDGAFLRRELTPYFNDMSSKSFAGVKLNYYPDENDKALVIQLNENNLHIGFRIDLVKDRFT